MNIVLFLRERKGVRVRSPGYRSLRACDFDDDDDDDDCDYNDDKMEIWTIVQTLFSVAMDADELVYKYILDLLPQY